MTAALEVDAIWVSFGRRDVLRDVSLRVEAGSIVALLGLNGAGKSVTAKAVAGLVPARRGVVRLAGVDMTRMSVEGRVRMGLRHLPQVGGVVSDLTVAENLRLGGFVVRRRRKRRYPEVLAGVLDRFPTLAATMDRKAGALSGGNLRMLALATALMAEPRLLVADEASAGLAPGAVDGLARVLYQLRQEGVGVLLVEQNVGLARSLADHVVVLDRGTVAYEATAMDLDESRLVSLLGLGPAWGL